MPCAVTPPSGAGYERVSAPGSLVATLPGPNGLGCSSASESVLKCSGTSARVASESVLECRRNQRSSGSGIRIPGDPHGRAITASMFSGLVYTVDPTDGSVVNSFDCENIVPHIETDVPGGMTQLLAQPARWADRILFASFEAGQVGMLDTGNVTEKDGFRQSAIVDLGVGAGPHDIALTEDDSRLVVTDYFLNEDDFGKIHFEGDHQVHVIQVSRDALALDTRFNLNFDAEFATPKRPHGIAFK